MTPSALLEWRRRVAQEYAVCSLAQDFSRRLTQVGAPASLIEGALLMALDELEHAVLAQEVAEELGSAEPVSFDQDSFKVYRSDDPVVDLTFVAVSNLCLGETLAVRVSHGLRNNATVAVARAALDRVVSDEPRHAALGWQTLDWVLNGPESSTAQEAVSNNLETWISDYRDAFAGAIPEPHLRDLGSADLAWGLATTDFHRRAFETTLAHDWAPRLARRGFTKNCQHHG